MAERKAEVLVGITVTLALLILLFGVIWGKGIDIFSRRVNFTVRFEDVQGLEKGDPVLVRGIKQGEVERIVLRAKYAEVRLWIRENIPIYSDLRIAVEMKELLGGKQITIDPGKNGQPVDFHQPFYGEMRGNIKELLMSTERTLSRTDSVVWHLKAFFEQDRLSKVLQSIDEVTNQAKEILTENRQDIRLTVQRLEEVTRAIHEDSTAIRIGDLVTQLDSTVYLMKSIAVKMESEEGTLGKLLRDRWLYDQLLKTSSDLDSLITDIMKNPKKYIHVSVF
jgi:phospholipid/cholesterol/gamma-HCH transport system substrate-binding protein